MFKLLDAPADSYPEITTTTWPLHAVHTNYGLRASGTLRILQAASALVNLT
jgi:hypothetical protein